MYSFSGGHEKGVASAEIKRNATIVGNPSVVVAEALEQLKEKLFYLEKQSGKYYFTSQVTINSVLRMKMENVEDAEIKELELELVNGALTSKPFKSFVWPRKSEEIPDDTELKLIVLNSLADDFMRQILEMKGNNPRVNRNTLFFFTPLATERNAFYRTLRKTIAYRMMKSDPTLMFTNEQEKEIQDNIKKGEKGLNDDLRRYYRLLSVPGKTGFVEHDLGIPTIYEERSINKEVYEALRAEGELLERISPLAIKERYLSRQQYLLTSQLYRSTMTTPGEIRFSDQEALETGIVEGVTQGIFGLGELRDEEPVCLYFREAATCQLIGNEILVREHLCKATVTLTSDAPQSAIVAQPFSIVGHLAAGSEGIGGAKIVLQKSVGGKWNEVTTVNTSSNGGAVFSVVESTSDAFDYRLCYVGDAADTALTSDPVSVDVEEGKVLVPFKGRNNLRLRFVVPKGKIADIAQITRFLQSKFNKILIELCAEDGEISDSDYDDKIMEAFMQLGIEPEEL
jgi:hypothetical protein